jgi:hypothetical protein
MQVDAAAAEETIQKHLDQMGAQSWSALMAVLTETRTAIAPIRQRATRSSELLDSSNLTVGEARREAASPSIKTRKVRL